MKLHSPIRFLNLNTANIGDVTQWFGENPALYARFDIKGHNGIDLVRPHGEPLYAIEDGIVVDAKNDPNGYGMHVRIVSDANTNGRHREWTYGHNSKNYVKIGDKVKGGQHIADMGNTGFVVSNATGNGFWPVNPFAGTHLHLGLREVNILKSGGWSYPGSAVSLRTLAYNNGYKGSIDPKPYLLKVQSDAPAQNKSIFQSLLRVQDLINRLKK